MRSSLAVVLITVCAILGCDTIKSYMPGPSANKAVSVPGDAGLVAYGTEDTLSLPADQPGAYWVVEDDTSKIVIVFNVLPGQDSAHALTPEMKGQLDNKRKYRVYFKSNKNATQPATIPS